MTETLLPCPFCGSADLQVYEDDYCGDYFSPSVTIGCNQCPAHMYLSVEKPISIKISAQDAVLIRTEITKKWNTRT